MGFLEIPLGGRLHSGYQGNKDVTLCILIG